MRTVTATRYVTALREGGSLPGLVEADDDGLYVVKFRGAGQGPRALVAEWLAGELARAVGLHVPDLVGVELDPSLGDAEPHEEIRDLVHASGGLNLGLDFLPGALPFNPAAATAVATIDPAYAAAVVWLDGLVTNPDRTVQNPNLLVWHGRTWLIDHGAALYIHHTWRDPDEHARRGFERLADHVLLPFAGSVADADDALSGRIDRGAARRAGRRAPGRLAARRPGGRRCRRPSAAPTCAISRDGWSRRDRSSRMPSVPAPPRDVFQYAIVRVVPRVERGEQLNAGVILLCRTRRFLGARTALDERRLAALAPDLDPATVRPHLEAIERIAAGDASAGPIARLDPAERFHWLVSPASTIIQPSEVHTGFSDDPAAELDHLFESLVL